MSKQSSSTELQEVIAVCHRFAQQFPKVFNRMMGKSLQEASSSDPSGKVWLKFFNDFHKDPKHLEYVQPDYEWFLDDFKLLHKKKASESTLTTHLHEVFFDDEDDDIGIGLFD